MHAATQLCFPLPLSAHNMCGSRWPSASATARAASVNLSMQTYSSSHGLSLAGCMLGCVSFIP